MSMSTFMNTSDSGFGALSYIVFFSEAHQTRSKPRRKMYSPAIDSVRTGVRLRAHEVPSTCRFPPPPPPLIIVFFSFPPPRFCHRQFCTLIISFY